MGASPPKKGSGTKTLNSLNLITVLHTRVSVESLKGRLFVIPTVSCAPGTHRIVNHVGIKRLDRHKVHRVPSTYEREESIQAPKMTPAPVHPLRSASQRTAAQHASFNLRAW